MDIEYQVQQILQERTYQLNGQTVTEYKVKWKGYALKDATWEPLQNLQGCADKLKRFQESKNDQMIFLDSDKKSSKKVPRQRKKKKDKEPTASKKLPFFSRKQFYFGDDQSQSIEQQYQGQQPLPILNKSFQSILSNSSSKSKSKLPGKQKKIKKQKTASKKQNKQKQIQKDKQRIQVESEYDFAVDQPSSLIHEPVVPPFPVKYIKPKQMRSYFINTVTVQVQKQMTQTEFIVNEQPLFNPNLKILFPHYSHQNPNQIYFTVKQSEKYSYLSRQYLLRNHPRVLYNYYHSYYVSAKKHYEELKRIAIQVQEGVQDVNKLDQFPVRDDQFLAHLLQIQGHQRPTSVQQWKEQLVWNIRQQMKRLMPKPPSPKSSSSSEQSDSDSNDEEQDLGWRKQQKSGGWREGGVMEEGEQEKQGMDYQYAQDGGQDSDQQPQSDSQQQSSQSGQQASQQDQQNQQGSQEVQGESGSSNSSHSQRPQGSSRQQGSSSPSSPQSLSGSQKQSGEESQQDEQSQEQDEQPEDNYFYGQDQIRDINDSGSQMQEQQIVPRHHQGQAQFAQQQSQQQNRKQLMVQEYSDLESIGNSSILDSQEGHSPPPPS